MSVLVTLSPYDAASGRSRDGRRAKRAPARHARGRGSSRGLRVWRATGAGSRPCLPDGNRASSRSADGVGYGDRAGTSICNADIYDVVSGSSSPLPGRRCSPPLARTTLREEEARRKRSEGEEDRLHEGTGRRCHRVNRHLSPGHSHALSGRRWQQSFMRPLVARLRSHRSATCPQTRRGRRPRAGARARARSGTRSHRPRRTSARNSPGASCLFSPARP